MEDYMKALEAEWIQILLLNAELPLSLNLLVDEIERCRTLPAPAEQSEPIIASCNDHSGDGEEDDSKKARRTWSSELQGPSSEPKEEEDGKNARGTCSPELQGPQSEPKEDDSKKACRTWSSELQGPSSEPKEDDSKKRRRTWSPELQCPSSEPKEDDSKKRRRTWSPELQCPPSELEEENSKKARRTWSAELQRSFHICVDQLGGPQAAKRLLELMNVNGLTIAEVSSRLQEYLDKMPPRVP